MPIGGSSIGGASSLLLQPASATTARKEIAADALFEIGSPDAVRALRQAAEADGFVRYRACVLVAKLDARS